MTTLSYGPPTGSLPSARPWHWWQWTLLVLGTLVATVASGVATLVTVFAIGTTCGTDATTSTLRHGQFWLLVVTAVAVLPAGLPALLRRSGRWRFVVSAGITATPPLVALVTLTSPADWTGTSFCF